MKYLIVTADDFGQDTSLNAGIVRAYTNGIVTDISILPTGSAFDDAVGAARSNGIRTIGAHLALTAFSPVRDVREIPTLVVKDGHFHATRSAFLLAYLLGRISLDEAYLELKGQIEKVAKTGLRITHIDCHEHLHMMPKLLGVFIRLAKESGTPAIRSFGGERPIGIFSPKKAYRFAIASALGTRSRRALKAAGIRSSDALIGFLHSGSLDERILRSLIEGLNDGVTELACHPGYSTLELAKLYPCHKGCEDELAALTGAHIKKLLHDTGSKLVSYADLIDGERT